MKRKSDKIAEIFDIPFVFQRQDFTNREAFDIWLGKHLDFKQELTLELACGNGEYTRGMAKSNPKKSFLGVDLKGARLWKGSREALEENLSNIAFLREDISDLQKYFVPHSVGEIWVTFPDPRPKFKDEKHRLLNPHFLSIYESILKKDGWLHLKTDSTSFFDYSLETVQASKLVAQSTLQYVYDIDTNDLLPESLDFKTKYELKFRAAGEKIKYLKFQFKG